MDFTLPPRILALVLAATLVGPEPERAAQDPRALDGRTASTLEALADGRLEAQRAGTLEQVAALTEAELDAHAEAQRSTPGLEDQRGGDVHFTDREVQIILWTAAVIAVVLILA